MAVGYLKENFAFGTLASTLAIGATQLTMTVGHSLPTGAGSFQLVIWDAVSFPNASDDSNVEIVTGSFNAGNVYDIVRAQESTSAIEHAAGEKVGLHYTAGVNVDDLDAANHPMARIAGSTFSTVQHMQDINHSAGWISGGGITDDTDGTITVAAGTGLIRATDSEVAEILFFDWAQEAGANVALVDNDVNYVYAEYNSGSPQVVATITERTDFNTNVLLATISRNGTTLHINAADKHSVGDHADRMITRLKETMPYGHVSGGIISETGTLNISITQGDFWRGLTEFITAAFNSSGADNFGYWYRQAGDSGWNEVAAQSAIDELQYDDNSGSLATLSNNKFGIHWVYLEVDSHVEIIYGRGDYTLAEAEDAQPPATTPDQITAHGFLAGKIIIQESDTVFTLIESAFQTQFQGSVATAHSSLTELDFATAGHTGFLASDGSVPIEADAANAPLIISCAHDTEATTAILTLRKSDNTIASPTLVDDNAVLGTIAFDGYDGSGFHTGAKIEARIDGTPSDGTDMPTELTFWTTPEASATAVERLAIKPDGGIFPAGMKSGTDQANASAAAGELYQDTNDDNTVKMGV